MTPHRIAIGTAAAVFAAAVGGVCAARPATYVRPHLDTAAGAVSVTFGGQTFVNKGLAGAGRLRAATRDFNGETLGSFSGMALRRWARNADGTYSGDLVTLPDRGPNQVGPFVDTTDYANRIHRHRLTFDPVSGAVTLSPDGGIILKDAEGRPFTGKDAGSGTLVRDGVTYPSPAAGEGAGRISLDSEGLAYLPDGSFYVSDEYGPGIFLFGPDGRQTGHIKTVPALRPMTDGHPAFTAAKPPASGRRNNQGLEALAVSPDGKRLIAILQSATVQDSGTGAATRNNTRILVYDISRSRTPSRPIGHYVLQLPIVRETGDGQGADVTAAQSEMLALNDHRFLVLARDGNGRGKGTVDPPVYKAVLLVDVAGASNLAGTPYEQGITPAAPGGVLAAAIRPVRQTELVNLLNPVQLARFGIDLSAAPSTPSSLPEKLEALALAPALDKAAPDDVFLLVGSDNDFETSAGHVNGQDFDAGLKGAAGSGTGDDDSLMLIYRLTLPKPPRR